MSHDSDPLSMQIQETERLLAEPLCDWTWNGPRLARALLAALESQTQARVEAEQKLATAPHEFYICRECVAVCSRVDEDGCCVTCGADPERIDCEWVKAIEQQLATETQARVDAERQLKLLSEKK